MSLVRRFFPPAERLRSSLRVELDSPSSIQHEQLYEEQQMRVEGRPLFVGFGFSGRSFLRAGAGVICLLAVLVIRAAWMQGSVEAKTYQAMAEQNRLRMVPVWPRRGVIRDRRGVVLAENAPRFQVTLVPRDLPIVQDDREGVISEASRLLGLGFTELETMAAVTGTRMDEPVLVADGLPYEASLALAVQLPDLPGFSLEARPKRSYPQSKEVQSLAHILGYVGKISESELSTRRSQGYRRVDELGKTGIERTQETTLRGQVGVRTYEVDARGRLKDIVREEAPVDGEDVTLSIDLRLQRAAEASLSASLKALSLSRGAVVAMDPRNGEILALVSLPAYDNNAFSGGVSSTVYRALANDEHQPLFARAVAGAYPSGSTVKIVVSVAALMERVITEKTTVLSTGGLRLGQWFFPDWKAGGHGTTDVRKAIAQSVNTFYYMIGGGFQSFQGMGPDALARWMQAFGLGAKTGIDLTGESAGFVPTRSWKETQRKQPWYVGDTYNLSIGQGDLLVTPLQVARYTAAIANGGDLVTPHLRQDAAAPRTPTGATAEFVRVAREGMRDAVTAGSARGLSVLSVSSGGKTGTAQWNSNRNTHAWFTAFAPYEAPEIVVTVLVEEGGEGSSVAVPIAREVLRAWAQFRSIPE